MPPKGRSKKSKGSVPIVGTSRRHDLDTSAANGFQPNGQALSASNTTADQSTSSVRSNPARAPDLPNCAFGPKTAHLFDCLKASLFIENLENYREFAHLVSGVIWFLLFILQDCMVKQFFSSIILSYIN